MNFLMCFLLLTTAVFAKSTKVETLDFKELMGKTTPHWSHVKHLHDREFLERTEEIYLKNKEAQFKETGAYKIPPIVHFIWLGPRAFPPESVENVRTWIEQNPGWTIKFWTDRDRDPPCEGMEKILVKDFNFLKLGRCYQESQNWGEKSDLLRYEILFQEGGVYADHDANCLRSFNGMNRGYDFFCCLETPHEAFVGKNITCGNGVLGSRAKHPTVAKVIELISEKWDALGLKFCGKDEYSKVEIVMQRTYIALTNALLQTIDQEGNVDIALPAAYFFSKSGIPSLYSKHFYAGSWDEFKEKKTGFDRFKEQSLGKLRQKNKSLSLLIVGLIVFNGILLSIFLIKRRQCL